MPLDIPEIGALGFPDRQRRDADDILARVFAERLGAGRDKF